VLQSSAGRGLEPRSPDIQLDPWLPNIQPRLKLKPALMIGKASLRLLVCCSTPTWTTSRMSELLPIGMIGKQSQSANRDELRLGRRLIAPVLFAPVEGRFFF